MDGGKSLHYYDIFLYLLIIFLEGSFPLELLNTHY